MKESRLRFLLISLCALMGGAGNPAWGDGGGVRVHNQASATITVNSDAGYGCTADAGDTCSFVMSLGPHRLTAKRHDNDNSQTYNINVAAEGYDLNLSDGNP